MVSSTSLPFLSYPNSRNRAACHLTLYTGSPCGDSVEYTPGLSGPMKTPSDYFPKRPMPIAGWILIVSIVAMLYFSFAAAFKPNHKLRVIHQRLGLATSYFKPLEPSPAPAVRLRATQR